MVATLPALEFGRKLQSAEAKACVDAVYAKMLERADRKVTNGKYMRELSKGSLPLEGIRVFWQNWYGFVAEINNLLGCAYQFHLPFFKRHWDLLAPLSDKVADEITNPKPPGHIEIVVEQGEIFGLTKEEMVYYPMFPECRALLEWHRGLLHEGTMIEYWASAAWEEYVGYWARQYREALLNNYGFNADQVLYFRTHEEADLEVHEGGIMAHGEFNRTVLQRLLEDGRADFRPGFSLEYAALSSIDLFTLFLDRIYQHVTEPAS